MKKRRTVMLFSVGLVLAALIGLCGAVVAPQAPDVAPAAAPDVALAATPDATLAAMGQPAACEDGSSCSGACAPVAGAWIAQLLPQEDKKTTGVTTGKDDKSKKPKPLLETFKFAPVNAQCDQFVVNAQTIARPERVIKAFPEVTDLTEFVGVACKLKPTDVNFTAISYGVERTFKADKTIFIAVLSGKIDVPKDGGKDGDHSGSTDKDGCAKCKCCKDGCKDPKCGCKTGNYSGKDGHPGQCACCKDACKYADCECKTGKHGNEDGKDWDQRKCDEPKELTAKLTVAYFDAEQDEDGDGFPDKDEEPIICLAFEAKFKRVQLQPQCKPDKGHTPLTVAGVQG